MSAVQAEGTAKQIARWVALAALFLVPLTPLIVADTFFFPFITGKAFFFRIVIEVAVAAWAVLALLDKEYRPRFSWIGVAVCAFVVWLFVADLFAINAAKAFWSNFERMEGWILLFHLLGFFVAASTVLRVERGWRAWFFTSLGVSVLVAGYALLQIGGALSIHQGSTRIDATLGNSAYLAIYFLFNVFIALWLACTEKRVWFRWSLIALAVLEAVLVLFTETRGTALGLVGTGTLVALLAALTMCGRIRRYAIGTLALIFVVAGSFYLARNTAFVQNNHVLQRIASISLSDGQTRFTIWHMAFEGALERPIIGWGQEGFNYVFNKFYEPSLFTQEQWFDRAHNAFLDWLIAGGIPAFVLYLSLFGAGVMLLWRSAYRDDGQPVFSRHERILLTAAFVGYACHNLFVFDNLYSYVYFFALLALIDARIARPIERCERLPEMTATQGSLYALPIAGAVAVACIWWVNVPGIRAAGELITALTPSADSPTSNISTFEGLIAHPSFATQEVREQLVSFASSVVSSQQATDEQKQQIASLAIQEMQKQVTAYPSDARERLQLAYAYSTAGDSENALAQIKVALALSPKKEEIWLEAGVAEWNAGNRVAAQQDFNTAYALGPQFSELALYAAAGDIVAGDQATADTLLQSAFGTTAIDSDVLIAAYYHIQNWPRLIALWKVRVAKPDATAVTWFGLAAAYYQAGDKANAIATIRAAIERFPEASSSGAAAIQQIETGTVSSGQ